MLCPDRVLAGLVSTRPWLTQIDSGCGGKEILQKKPLSSCNPVVNLEENGGCGEYMSCNLRNRYLKMGGGERSKKNQAKDREKKAKTQFPKGKL